MSTEIYILLVLLLLTLIGAFYYLRSYRHPIVLRLSTDSSQLLVIPLEQLQQAKRLLQRTHRLKAILADNDVHITWLDNAINFVGMSNQERSELIAERLMATCENIDANVFKLSLGETFPLNVSDCLLYFPPANLPTADDIIRYLQRNNLDNCNMVIITLEPTQQIQLRPYGEDRTTRLIVPTSRELTALLLQPKPTDVFVFLLANQLAITQISPYMTKGGVTKNSAFFGREKIITDILNRKLANYLIIGGRQLGKSSLLKRIKRHYENHSKVECYYLTLWGSNLQDILIDLLKLPEDTQLNDLFKKLGHVPAGKQRLLLIDEADEFIRSEKANNYPVLSFFRGLSELGNCHFIFAGFWNLHDASDIDYQSPIKNFGRTIHIGKLETKACRQLATKPMAMLGIRYESEKLVAQILTETGQRANLIATVCDEILNKLAIKQRVLTQKEVNNALHSKAIAEALSGWGELTGDEQATRLDRIIIYATIKKGEFTKTALLNFLNKYRYSYTTTQLEKSLKRLEIAFIIQRDNKNRYNYCVPLFRKMLLKEDLIALLKQELIS